MSINASGPKPRTRHKQRRTANSPESLGSSGAIAPAGNGTKPTKAASADPLADSRETAPTEAAPVKFEESKPAPDPLLSVRYEVLSDLNDATQGREEKGREAIA